MTFPPEYFVPSTKVIQSITNANPGVVETTTSHNYSNGLYVRVSIPVENGMQGLNGNVYLITILTDTSFSIDQDTQHFDVFSPVSDQPSEVIPVGEIASTLDNCVKNNYTIIPES